MNGEEPGWRRASAELSKVGAAAARIRGEVATLRGETRHAGELAAETLELLKDGFILLGRKLDALDEFMTDVPSPHRASHWISPYVERRIGPSPDPTELQHTQWLKWTEVAILNPGSESVQIELALKDCYDAQVASATLNPESTILFTFPALSGSYGTRNGWLDLTASAHVLPAGWILESWVYARKGSEAWENWDDTPSVHEGEPTQRGFAIPWYPVN